MNEKIGSVKILSAALDQLEDGTIILRGVIAPESLQRLRTDDYQREALPLTAQSSILSALNKNETLPDVELGMRGDRFIDRDEAMYLQDPVYIIDGLQRISTAIHALGVKSDLDVRIGCLVHFKTSRTWERNRFRVLNSNRLRVSPNVLLRNYRSESPAVLNLYGLTTNDKSFVLYDRVTWSQRMAKGELITAMAFTKVVGRLHSHKAPTKRSQLDELVPAFEKLVDVFGLQLMRENTKTFFDLVDECWGIKRVQYREGAVHMRSHFLIVLASLVSDHHDFWRQPDEKKLFVEASLRRKLAQFPTHDPQVVNLASSAGKSREILYMLLRDHINSGKRTKRLTSRVGDVVDMEETDAEDEASAA